MCAVLAHVGKTEFMMGEKMWKPALILFLSAGLSGCEMEQALMEQPKTSAKPSTEKSSTTPFVGSNCELKNPAGTGKCEDGRGANVSPVKAPAAVSAQPRYEPWMCETGPQAMGPVWGAMLSGNLKKLQDYCIAIEGGSGAAASTAPLPQSQRPKTQKGGGCVWKGRSYSPGDTIYYTEGRILSQDLFINGRTFDHFTGKAGPWQMCECQVSVGHWGCV